MTDRPLNLEDCTTVAELREGVDALDRELVALLATRFGYMRAAARIKPGRKTVRDEARKASVRAMPLPADGLPNSRRASGAIIAGDGACWPDGVTLAGQEAYLQRCDVCA